MGGKLLVEKVRTPCFRLIITQWFPQSALASAVLLLLLFPIALANVTSSLFTVVWIFHVILQIIAVFTSLLWISATIRELEWGRAVFSLTILLFGVFLLVQCNTPILARDSLIYHLQTAKLWLEEGKIVEIPWLEWSYFPMLMSLAYLGFLKLGADFLTPYYHLSYLFCVSAVVARYIERQTGDRELSVIGFLLTLTLPLAIGVGVSPMADLGVSLGFAIATYLTATEREVSTRDAILAGVALGFALSMKYVAFLAASLFVPFLFFVYLRGGIAPSVAFRRVGTMSIMTLFIVLPWLVRNALWTGNPMHPFLSGLFGSSDAVPFMGELKPIPYRREAFGESWLELLLLPFRMILFGEDDNAEKFAGVLSPILLLGFLPLLSKRNRSRSWVFFAALTLGAYWVFSLLLFYAYSRYLLSLLILGISLTCVGIDQFSQLRDGRYRRWIQLACLGVHLFFAAMYCVRFEQRTDAFPYLLSRQTKAEYLRAHLTEYAMIEYMNEHIPDDSLVYLLLTGNRYYYYHSKARGGYFSGTQVTSWIREAKTAADIGKHFTDQGFSYLMFHKLRMWSLQDDLSPDEFHRWITYLEEETTPIYQNETHALYRVASD